MIDGREALRKFALNAVRLSGLPALAGPLVGGIGAILMLHRVTASPEKPDSANRHLTISPGFLDAVLTDMKRAGYIFVTIEEAVGIIAAGGAGGQFAAVTLDDGYRDNLVEALPVFESHGTPFTIYLAPALTGGVSLMWWELIEDIVLARDLLHVSTASGRVSLDCATPAAKLKATEWLHRHVTTEVPEEDQAGMLRALAHGVGIEADALRRRLLMSWDEIRAIAGHPLATIGAHTIHHYNLRRLSDEKAWREIAGAADAIEVETGVRPRHMAYPYGYASAVGAREVRLAREAGYASAVTTRHGVVLPRHAAHLTALPRISINGRYQRLAHVQTMLSGVTTPLANAGRRLVTV